MKQQMHTIEAVPWSKASTGVRVVCETTSMMLWPLSIDDRLTALISLLANQIDNAAESEDEIDAIVEIVRMQLKMKRRWESPSPPIQNH
jgi:hypothetical protein